MRTWTGLVRTKHIPCIQYAFRAQLQLRCIGKNAGPISVELFVFRGKQFLTLRRGRRPERRLLAVDQYRFPRCQCREFGPPLHVDDSFREPRAKIKPLSIRRTAPGRSTIRYRTFICGVTDWRMRADLAGIARRIRTRISRCSLRSHFDVGA